MKIKTGLAFKLCFLILSFTGLIFASILLHNRQASRRMIVNLVKSGAESIATATVFKIEAQLIAVQKVAENVANGLEDAEIDESVIHGLLNRVITKNEVVFGTAIAFEPFAMDPDQLYYSPYYYRGPNGIESTNLGGPDYRYFYRDWYQIPKELGFPVWSEPYYSEGGSNRLMATYSVPFHRQDHTGKTFMGVVTVDISLDWLEKIVSSVHIFESGYGFLLSKHGTFVTHPRREYIMNETIFSIAEAGENAGLRSAGKAMTGGRSGFMEMAGLFTPEPCYFYYTPLPANEWSVGIVFPKKEMMAGADRLSREILFIGAGGLLLLLLVIVWIARSITKPIRLLSQTTKQIASGDLEVAIPEIRSKDEVGELADHFENMRVSLNHYIQDLTAATAARERMESELKIAHEIQMGILPCNFCLFDDHPEFDLFAYLKPAREVGGDLYDFFFIDERHFCFLVGDVSGKGIPAAIFMAVSKTLLKSVAEPGTNPGEMVTKLNQFLFPDNDACMFVTLFCAVVDIRTGEMQFTSAGHNPPVLVTTGTPAQWLKSKNGPLAGVFEDIAYTTSKRLLEPGDTIYLYTDGVTEAIDLDEKMYGDDRLLEFCRKAPADKPPQSAVEDVIRDVEAFVGEAEQFDDITLLVYRYHGNKESDGNG